MNPVTAAPTVEPFCVSDTFVTGAGPLQFMGEKSQANPARLAAVDL